MLEDRLKYFKKAGIDAESLTIVYDNHTSIRKNLQDKSATWELVDDPWRPDDGQYPEETKYGPGSVIDHFRILIFTPAHPVYGIHPQTLESIQKAMDCYDGPVEWLYSKGDNPLPYPYENVTYQHNKVRQLILENEYDALLSVEADMIIPPDTIGKLLDTNADIAYGLYVWRNKPRRWNVYTDLTLWGGTSVSLNHDGSDAREAWGKVMDVAGLGMGCTLIKRDVLKAMQFRIHDGRPDWIADEYKEDFDKLGKMMGMKINPYRPHPKMVCDDWLLAMDAQHYGFVQRCDLNVICGHIGNDGIIWPDPNEKMLYRIEEIRS